MKQMLTRLNLKSKNSGVDFSYRINFVNQRIIISSSLPKT